MNEDDKNPNQGWIHEKTYEYDPSVYADKNFSSISEIIKEVESLDPDRKPEEHDFMYLLHLNRVAADIVRNSGQPLKQNTLDALFHTANKDIWGAMIFSDRVNRIPEFRNAVKMMLMDLFTVRDL